MARLARSTATVDLLIRRAPVDGRAVGSILPGTVVTVTDESAIGTPSVWCAVCTSDGVEGYAASWYLEEVTPTQEETPVIVPDPPRDASNAEHFTLVQDGAIIGYGVVWYAGGPVTLMVANEDLFRQMLADGVQID